MKKITIFLSSLFVFSIFVAFTVFFVLSSIANGQCKMKYYLSLPAYISLCINDKDCNLTKDDYINEVNDMISINYTLIEVDCDEDTFITGGDFVVLNVNTKIEYYIWNLTHAKIEIKHADLSQKQIQEQTFELLYNNIKTRHIACYVARRILLGIQFDGEYNINDTIIDGVL